MLKKHGANNKSKRVGSGDEEAGAGPSRETSHASPLFRKSASIDPPESLSDNENRPRPPSQQSARGEAKKKILSSFLSNLFGNKTPEDDLNNKTNIDGKKSTSRESVNSVLSSSSFSYVNPKKVGGKQMKGKRIPVDDPNYGKIGDGRKTLGATLDRIGMKMGLKKKYNLQSCESLQYIDACEDAPPLPLLDVLNGSSPPQSMHVTNSSPGVLSSDDQLGHCEIVPTTVTELSAECQAITNHFSDKSESKAVEKTSARRPESIIEIELAESNASSSQNASQKIVATKLSASKPEEVPSKTGTSTASTAKIVEDILKSNVTSSPITKTTRKEITLISDSSQKPKTTSTTQDCQQRIQLKSTTSNEGIDEKIAIKSTSLTAVSANSKITVESASTEIVPQKQTSKTKSSIEDTPKPMQIKALSPTTDGLQTQVLKPISLAKDSPQKIITKANTSTPSQQTATISSVDTTAPIKVVTASASTSQETPQKLTILPNFVPIKIVTATTTPSSQETPKKLAILPTSSPNSQAPQSKVTKIITPSSSQGGQQSLMEPPISSDTQEASKNSKTPIIPLLPHDHDIPEKAKTASSSAQTASQPVTRTSESVIKPTEISKPSIQNKEPKHDSSIQTSSLAVGSIIPSEISKEPETKLSQKSTDEPVASTSKACLPSLPPLQSPTSSTQTTAGGSNTWSSSTKRKRRAPPPPTDKPSQKFTNGVASNSSSIVTEIPYDVPSSSSHAAALLKFKRINESPVRSIGTFEIRPRKKERSVEPPSVTRPVSYVTAQNSSTLYSPHSSRYHHRRSSSESFSNTNTRGRVHKPGKKKAPPPPNPFGDPDAEEDTEDSHTPVSVTATNINSSEIAARGSNSTVNTSSASSSVFSSPQVAKKTSEKPPIGKVASTVTGPIPPQQTQEPTASSSNSSNQTSNVSIISSNVPVPSLDSPVNVNTPIQNTQSLTTSEPVTVALTVATNPDTNSIECSSDELDEIRQNMLNDQQEMQLLASDSSVLSVSNHSDTGEQGVSRQVSNSTPSTSSIVEPSSTTQPLSRDDIQAAQNALQALTTSASTPKPQQPSTSEAGKAKLIELKKEADKSPLNALPKKSRPVSIGSSIYESPLALLLGKSSTSNSGATGDSSAENSPRATPKPWYKRSASSAFAKQLMSPKSKQSSVKPFTALVKFSDLDKEAAKIVEENRRKSAEQRFNENAQELLALFSSTFPEPTRTTAQDIGESSMTSTHSPVASASPLSSVPTKVSTVAQVHVISEETELANQEEFTASGNLPAQNQVSSVSPSGGLAGPIPPTNSGSSSPPAFQSVHAASKHRQIKPLQTTSPNTPVRSEKLAIVQPQSSSSAGKESGEIVPWRVTRTGAQTSTPSTVITTSTIPSSTQPLVASTSSSTSVAVRNAPTEIPVSSASTLVLTPTTVATSPSTTTITASSIMTPTTTSSTTSAFTPSQTKSNAKDQQWDCPRCTLKNPNWRILCEVCFHRKDPVSPNSYISSILQRVNAESTKVSTNTVVTPPETTIPSTTAPSTSSSAARQRSPTRNSVNDASSLSVITNTPVPPNSITSPSSTAILSSQSFTPTTTSSPSVSHQPRSKDVRKSFENKQSDIPSCENFLSQLPAKQDLAKEEKLYGMKLHEDPELEELDIGKLREARLAYFQKQNSTDASTTSYYSAASSTDESVESPINNLGTHDEHHHQASTNLVPRDDTFSSQSQVVSKKRATLPSSSFESDRKTNQQPQEKYADNDDDFIDYILQLDNNVSPTNVSNIPVSDSCSRPLMPTSSTSLPTSSITPQPPPSSPNMFLQNRYRPRLEMIREGNSGDYTYCYSSTEIAQIYENWQANENTNRIGNKSLANVSSSSSSQASSGMHPFPHQTHLFEYHQQPQQTSTTVHQHPMVLGNNVYPSSTTSPPFHATQSNFVSIGPVDHQPYANNRLSHSPEDNYVNTIAGAGIAPTATTTPTLHESANISCATSPPVRFSPFPTVHSNIVNDTASSITVNMSRSGDRQINQRFGESPNYENNGMSLTPGSSRRLTYDDYRRMGAIPKGYSFSSRNDDWSSESSCDTDTSSRGNWARAGYQDGMTRRGTLDIPHGQSNGFPEQNAAVSKLMKRLEAAIANGDHRLAATLAHDLALMKVNCVVAKINQPFSIRVYVEDRFMQQGPFLIQVSSMMTVHELKAKIESDWGIPSGFQKWILGRKMAEDDNLSLSSYEMAQDSMAFLFLVTPDIGNVRSNVVPIDNKASNNIPSTSVASASVVIKNINKSDRNSMSPIQRNIMPSYANLNENSGHVYNNFSMANPNIVEQPAPISQSPRVVRKSVDSPATVVSESNVKSPSSSVSNQKNNATSVASSKNASSAQTTSSRVAAATTKQIEEKRDNRDKESAPPPLPCRSPIPQVQAKSEKGSSTPIKAHSKTPERTNSNPSSLKSNQKNVKQQGSSSKTSANQAQQQKAINAETLNAASVLTLSLQQKLAEFKNLAELTFSKTGAPTPSPNRSIKEPSPVSSKIINVSEVEKKVDPKDAKPPRKPGKTQPQPVPSSSKEKRLASASSSTEKLTKDGAKSDNEKDPIKENRFNGVLLPTPTENVKPPERSDKTKASTCSGSQEVTAKQRLLKADKNIYENRPPKDNIKSDVPATVQLKPDEVKENAPEKVEQPLTTVIATPVVTAAAEESATKPLESSDISGNSRSPIQFMHEEFLAPKPMPRGLKKQQSVERELQSPERPLSAPKPAPRTAANKQVTSGAPCDSKDLPSHESVLVNLVAPTLTTSSNASATPETTQQVVEGGCQTTLPFPLAKHRGMTTSPPNIKPASFNAATASTSAVKPDLVINEKGTSLLRPSAFVTQKAKSSENDGKLNSSSSRSSSVLLSYITANSSTPTVAPTQSTIVNNIAVPSSSSSTTTPNIAHVQPFSTKQVSTSTPTAHVAPYPSSSNSTQQYPEAPSKGKSKEDNVNSYLKMVELMEKQDLILTSEDSECPICFAPLLAGDGVVLRDCLHVFCKDCLIGCVQYADDCTVIKCPFRDADYSCSNNLQEREIRALVPVEVFEKYLLRSVKLAESKIVNTFHCKTSDCTGWCVYEEDQDDVNVFLCPVCKKRNCLTCAAIHEGVDCLTFQRELAIAAETDEDAKQSRLMLEKMIQRGEALECPACHVVLLKKWGCDWVRCSYCKTEICWVTKGFRWGKGGKGDVSGGCKCGVNGVKCHPKCTYCH